MKYRKNKRSKLHFGVAIIAYFGAAFLALAMLYLGNSYHRHADSNKELSGNIQALIEAYTSSEKDFCLLAPAPDDWLIWEEMPYRSPRPNIQPIKKPS